MIIIWSCTWIVLDCLTRELCAPVGTVLCGSKNFIEEAWLHYKPNQGWGAMHQVGALAADCLYALEHISLKAF